MKGKRLAVIKCVATIILAFCTLCTEVEAPMAIINVSAPIVATEVNSSASRPSS